MTDTLLKPTVLVLNRNWQAINVRAPQHAFQQMATDVATALDIDGETMIPLRWSDWVKLAVRPQDQAVRTPRGLIRIPTVIVVSNFARVPKRRPKFSSRAVWERDGGQCQYTGRKLRPGEGNIDHIVPRSRKGPTSWENCVLADKEINRRKGDRLPGEVGLSLLKRPVAPQERPSTFYIRNTHKIGDWKPFLHD